MELPLCPHRKTYKVTIQCRDNMKYVIIPVPGTTITFDRDAGSCVMFRVGFEVGQEENAVRGLLDMLSYRQEIGIVDPANTECSLEARKTADGFMIKRGCHGCYGTWRTVTVDEAFDWLLPGAVYAAKTLRKGYGGQLVEYR